MKFPQPSSTSAIISDKLQQIVFEIIFLTAGFMVMGSMEERSDLRKARIIDRELKLFTSFVIGKQKRSNVNVSNLNGKQCEGGSTRNFRFGSFVFTED